MDPCLLTAEAELSDLERRAQAVAADLEYVSPHVAENVSKIASLARAARIDLSRELRRAGRQPVAA